MNNLTPAQIESMNRKIAEFDGWRLEGDPISGFMSWNKGLSLPNYTSSLDAIVPLVRGLGVGEKNLLHNSIKEMAAMSAYNIDGWVMFIATPADYCLAYLVAKGEKDV